MNVSPSILCPIDFSDASAGALLYAAAIASHVSTKVVVLTVEEPLLTEALDLGTGASWTREHCQLEMEQFATATNTEALDAMKPADDVTEEDIERAIAEIQDAIKKVPR